MYSPVRVLVVLRGFPWARPFFLHAFWFDISQATDNIMVPRLIPQRAPATCSLGCGATCSCPCIHIYCPENSDPAGCCVTFLKLHVIEICLHIEHRHVSTHTKQKKQQHNNYILTMWCNDMARRSSTGDACLQAGPRRAESRMVVPVELHQEDRTRL